MGERIRFWLRCLDHLDRKGHWPKDPIVYADFFLCRRCNRGSGRGVRVSLWTKPSVAVPLGYG